MDLIFFGSFQSYSVQVLDQLAKNFTITAVVTTPPAPAGRHLTLTPTEVALYAKKHKLPLYELQSLDIIPSIDHPDFLVVAGYGKLIPTTWLDLPKIMAINLHQSLLPKYRGRCPAEWAILRGETETGITLIQMTPDFDRGPILAQATLPIDPADTRETLYKKLYALGTNLLVESLPQIASGQITARPQASDRYFYARQITREDGFIPWDEFTSQLSPSNPQLARKLRALAGWPGVWTTDPSGKRLKLVSLNPTMVQYEGKKPQSWNAPAPSLP